MANGFQDKTGIAGVIGTIDGTHIPILAPALHRNSYINWRGHAIIQLQAVCTSEMMFHCLAGVCARCQGVSELPIIWPLPEFNGSVYHLLGDSAYPFSTSLITPYRDNGHLSRRQKKFSTLHSSTTTVIERVFGCLKGKWR